MFPNVYDKKFSLNNDYISNSKDIPQNIILLFKKLFGKIYSNFEKIISLSNQSSLDELIFDIKNSFETTEEILYELNFKDEYYDYSSIKNIAFYILDNYLFQYISFIKDLISSFQVIIQYKMQSPDDEYESKYDEFTSNLMDAEQNFFTKIYNPSENYDEETLSKITNSLMDL